MHRSFFGAVIRKLRLQQGWTQEHLASHSDLERTFISMLERGIKQPSLKTIGDLAKAFNLKNYELLHMVEQEIHAAQNTSAGDQECEEEEHRLEALELEQEKSRIGEIVNAIPVVFFARTPMPEYAATFISRNIRQLLGFERDSFMESSQFWLEHIHPEDQSKVLDHLQNMTSNGLLNHEYRFLTASGQWLQIREELRLVADKSGIQKEILGSMTGELSAN